MYPRLSYGWCPDVPDFRDYAEHSFSATTQSAVDLREPGLEPIGFDAVGIHASCAMAVVGMIDWQARKWVGKRIDASASFLHQLTIRVTGGGGIQGVSLRSSLKILTQFGAPPEHLWPSRTKWFQRPPKDPELFGFARRFQQLKYLRLDPWTFDPIKRLSSIRRWVAAGNPCLLGFAVPTTLHSLDTDTIPFDLDRGGIDGGSVCIVLGYDDHIPLPRQVQHPLISESNRETGALLIKTCWGETWGNRGYGWLPYAFVDSYFARDAWAVMHPQWM